MKKRINKVMCFLAAVMVCAAMPGRYVNATEYQASESVLCHDEQATSNYHVVIKYNDHEIKINNTKGDVEPEYFFVPTHAKTLVSVVDDAGNLIPVKKWSINPDDIYSAKRYDDYQVVVYGTKEGEATLTAKLTKNVDYKMPLCFLNNTVPAAKNLEMQKGTSTEFFVYKLSMGGGIKVTSEDTSIVTVKQMASDNPFIDRLKISAKKSGTTKIQIFNQNFGEKLSVKVTIKDKLVVSPVKDYAKATRRALVIGQTYDGDFSLDAPLNDMEDMSKTLEKTGYKEVTTLNNASKAKIKKAIQAAFKDATENDISLFYFSGHGSADGALCSFEDNEEMGFVSPKLLAKWLSNVPGKVVVILDSCYSGKAIEKSKGLYDTKSTEDAQSLVIEAFQMQDRMLSQKSGALKERGKFFVITSCSASEVCADDGENGLFTRTLIEGAGYSCDTNQRLSKAPADIAKDNKLTMEELWRYSLPRALGNAKCYPANCGMKIFQR